MCVGAERLTRQQQKQEQIRTQIRRQLPAQQTWDPQESQTLQQRRDAEAMTLITRQIGINETLSAQMQQMPAAQAESVAEGTPEQTLQPAQKSWKERREEAKRKKAQTSEMQQHTRLGDHVTYAFAKAKQEINEAKANSFPPEMRAQVRETSSTLAAEHRVDVRVLEVFVNGYRKNAQGEPLNEEEAQKKAQDEAFLQDYIASNLSLANGRSPEDALALRRPHLQRITHEMLNVKISADMLTDEYLYSHAAEVMELADRFTCFINIMEEPTNQQFFTELSKYEQDWLKARAASMEGFRQMVPHLVNVRGVKYNSRDLAYMTDDDVEYGIPLEKANLQEQSLQFEENLKTDREKQRKAAFDETERLRKELRGDDLEPLEDTAGLQMLRELFLHEPEKYAQHKEALDRLYQQYYRAVDTLRDLTRDSAAYGEIVGRYREATDIHRHLAQTACHKQMEAEAQAQLIRQQMESMSGLMNFFLGGATLTEQARALARQEGLEDRITDAAYSRLSGKERLARTAERLEKLTFTDTVLPLQGLDGMEYAMVVSRAQNTTPQTERAPLEHMVKSSSLEAHYDTVLGGTRSAVIGGLYLGRVIEVLTGYAGEGYAPEALMPMLEKLTCGNRYRGLKLKQENKTLTEEEGQELAEYSDQELQRLEDVYSEGIRELKTIYLDQLHRLQSKYGTLMSQLHPEDFLARIGKEFFSETLFVQDLYQLVKDSGAHPEHTLPDGKEEELQKLTDYYGPAATFIRNYGIGAHLMNDEQGYRDVFHKMTDHENARRMEKDIRGPSLSAEEEATYHQLLRQRGVPNLYGRFAPGAADAAPGEQQTRPQTAVETVEEAQEEVREEEVNGEALEEAHEERQEAAAEQAVEESLEEVQTEAHQAVIEQLVHEAVLEEVQEEAWTDEGHTAEEIVEHRMKTLTFNQTTGGSGALTEENLMEIKRREVVPDQARYDDLLARRDELFFNSGKYGNLSVIRSHGGKVIGGMGLRSLSLYGGALGEGKTNEQLIAMFEKLYVSDRYEQLKKKENSDTMTEAETAEFSQYTEENLERTFDEGMLEMKETMYAHLCRLRDKYGRYPSQLHPKDLLAKLGPEFYNETHCVQDLMQFLNDGKAYFDFTTDKDREFRDLAIYYHSLSEVIGTIAGDMLDYGEVGPGLRVLFQHANTREFLKLEKNIRGPGFDAEEKAVYEEQAYQRMKDGGLWQIDHFEIRHDLRHPRNPDIAEIRRSRKDAISTESDQKAASEKAALKSFCDKQLPKHLREQNSEVADIHASLAAYTQASRYDVGYTEERRLLKAAIRKVEKAIRRLPPEGEQDEGTKNLAKALHTIRSRLTDNTSGELKVPDGADVLDYSNQQPTEEGSIQRGSKRNALVRKLSYWSDQKDTPLFTHSPTVNDLKQRTVSNCYMVASVAGLVHVKPHVVKDCLKDNGDGTVTVRLYEKYESDDTKAMKRENEALIKQTVAERKEAEKASRTDGEDDLLDELLEEDDIGMEMEVGKELAEKGRLHEIKPSYRPIYVKVSKDIPRIAGADALSAGALWMQMIEKACAFLGRNGVKGYQSLWYGEGGGFLERLLGAEAEKTEMSDELFDEICTCQVDGCVFNAGTKGGVGKEDGLNAGHAYTVMGGKWVGGKRYVLLRNPYSTMSMEHQEDGTKSRTGQHLDTHSDETYGQFYMDFETFRQKFDNVTRFKIPRG